MTTEQEQIEKPEPVLETHPVQAKAQGVVSLAVTPEALVEFYKQYEDIKKKLLTENDYVIINGVKTIAKSGWFKLGVAFNLDTLIINEQRRVSEDSIITWEIAVQCRAPNGRLVQEVGVCDDGPRDRKDVAEHVVKAMAMTRATERAYIKMLGSPDSAAEDARPNKTPTKFCKCEAGPATTQDGTCKNCGEFSKLWWEKSGKTVQ